MANGRMFTIQGWGKVIKSEDHASRVVLADVGEFLIYGPGALREKVLASIPITEHSPRRLPMDIGHPGAPERSSWDTPGVMGETPRLGRCPWADPRVTGGDATAAESRP
jgi:hypothetical protein